MPIGYLPLKILVKTYGFLVRLEEQQIQAECAVTCTASTSFKAKFSILQDNSVIG